MIEKQLADMGATPPPWRIRALCWLLKQLHPLRVHHMIRNGVMQNGRLVDLGLICRNCPYSEP